MGWLLPKLWPSWLRPWWLRSHDEPELALPVQSMEERQKDMLLGWLFEPFTTETKETKYKTDLVRLAPPILNGASYATPTEVKWARIELRNIPVIGHIINGLFQRAQDDDEALFAEIGLNEGHVIGQAAFRTPFEGNVMTGIDAMWAAMGMRQVVLDRFVWLAVSLTQGISPPPIQTVFCPYPEVIDKDEEIQAILKLLSGWKKILARFRTSTEASASGMSRISQGDGGSSSSNSSDVVLSLLEALGTTFGSRHLATVYQNFIYAALALQALLLVCSIFNIHLPVHFLTSI